MTAEVIAVGVARALDLVLVEQRTACDGAQAEQNGAAAEVIPTELRAHRNVPAIWSPPGNRRAWTSWVFDFESVKYNANPPVMIAAPPAISAIAANVVTREAFESSVDCSTGNELRESWRLRDSKKPSTPNVIAPVASTPVVIHSGFAGL